MDEHGTPVNTQTQVRDTQEKEARTEHLKHRDVFRVCRNATRKTEAHLELKTWPRISGTTSKHINNKWKMKENVGLLLNGMGTLVTENAKETELLNAFCPSVFTDKTSP